MPVSKLVEGRQIKHSVESHHFDVKKIDDYGQNSLCKETFNLSILDFKA